MNAKRLVYISVFTSLLGLILLFFGLAKPEDKVVDQPAEVSHEVLVAQQDVGAGANYRAALFTWQVMSETQLQKQIDYIEKSNFIPSSLHNTVIAAGLVKGQILSPSDFLKPEQGGFLSVMLRPNFRAVSIPVDQVTATSGLIGPGDYVDVLLLASKEQELRSRGNETQSLYVKTIAKNVRVLALNAALQVDSYMAAQKSNKGMVPDDSTATLEVSPLQANKVTLANQLGTLSMVLRSKTGDGIEVAVVPAINVDDILPAIKQVQPDIGLVEFRAKEKRIMNNAGTQDD